MIFCTLSLTAQFDKVYLVSGLRRSGNHLLLQTIYCNCPPESILFINDFPALLGEQYTDLNIELQYNVFEKTGMFRKSSVYIPYSDSGKFKCGGDTSNKLIRKEDIDNLEAVSATWTYRKKILIISFEDQLIEKMSRVRRMFESRCNKIYEIIIIRDIINCFASRIKAYCDRKKAHLEPDKSSNEYKISSSIYEKGGLFVTNIQTLELWHNHFSNCSNPSYIVFNYNKIICDDREKELLCAKLDVQYKEEYFKEASTFGKGSSFGAQSSVDSLMTRFSNLQFCEKEQETLMTEILSNPIIIQILKEQFLLDLTHTDKEYLLKVCARDKIHNVPKFNPYLEPQEGGYYEKYLKYKNKYMNLKKLSNHN